MADVYIRDPLTDVRTLVPLESTTAGGVNTVTFAPMPPVTGTWQAGDVCWNNVVTNGGIIGWRCFASGTPGSWLPMGNHATANTDYAPVHLLANPPRPRRNSVQVSSLQSCFTAISTGAGA